MVKFYVTILLLIHYCNCYKLLVVFPIPGKSHSILGEGIVRPLLNAGHEVTYITPIPLKNPPPKLKQIDVSSNFDLFPTEIMFSFGELMKKDTHPHNSAFIEVLMRTVSNGTVMHDNVQKLLHDPKEHFDAVIVEWMYNEIYAGFASVFNCPLIWSSSMEPHRVVLSLIDEAPNPAYTADIFTTDLPPFTFNRRIQNLLTQLKIFYEKWWASSYNNECYMRGFSSAAKMRGNILLPLDITKYNGSLMLGNSHVSTGQAIKLPQNFIPIGGYHISHEVNPLPQELQKVMDGSEYGVIYFSMGSMLRSKSLPVELKRNILNMFGELKYTVIWKFEEKLANLPKNVHIVEWAPQPSILSHPNCVLFITHGGLLSTTETLHFGVPIIGIPMFADQFNNVDVAVKKGFAKRVDLNFETPINLKLAIDEILENPRYRERVKELSLIYHDRPVPPATTLVHWVQHVVRTRGALHLRSPALDVPLYQKLYLDLLALIISGLSATFLLVRIVINKLFIETRKEKSN